MALRIGCFDFRTAPLDEYRHDDKAALDAHKAVIVGVSLSVSEGTGIYVPLRHRTGGNADSPEKIMDWLVKAVFTNSAIIKAAHNLSFEAMFLYALGIVVQPPCYDTIAAAQMTLKNNTEFRSLGDSGLKALVPELFDVDLPSFEAVTDGRYFDELDPRDTETIRYACADSDYTLRLYHLFNNWFDRYLPKHRYVVEEIESPTAVYVGLMKYNGLLVDRELMLKKQAEAEAKLAELKNEIAFMIGDVEIGANASTAAFKNPQDGSCRTSTTVVRKRQMMRHDLLSDWSRKTGRSWRGCLKSWFRIPRRGKTRAPDGYLSISSRPPVDSSRDVPAGRPAGRP